MSCMTPVTDGMRHLHRGSRGAHVPRPGDGVAHGEPSARLPHLRRRRRMPSAGYGRHDRPRLPPLPLHEAHAPQPGPRAFHQPRDEPMHPVLPLHPLLPRLRGRQGPGGAGRARRRVFRPADRWSPGERVQRQPRGGLPHGRVHRQDAEDALRAQMGPADGAVALRALRGGLQHGPRRALRHAAARAHPLQRRGERLLPLRPGPLRLRVRQRRARGSGSRWCVPGSRLQPATRCRRRLARGPCGVPRLFIRRSDDRHRFSPGVAGNQLCAAQPGGRRELLPGRLGPSPGDPPAHDAGAEGWPGARPRQCARPRNRTPC